MFNFPELKIIKYNKKINLFVIIFFLQNYRQILKKSIFLYFILFHILFLSPFLSYQGIEVCNLFM